MSVLGQVRVVCQHQDDGQPLQAPSPLPTLPRNQRLVEAVAQVVEARHGVVDTEAAVGLEGRGGESVLGQAHVTRHSVHLERVQLAAQVILIITR